MSSFSERSGLLYSSHRNPEFEINVAPDKNIKTDTSMANKDDKLTQSQLLKRMLEAEERDNVRERGRDADADEREQMDRDRLNETRFGM